jgi:hypothetical protein
MPGPRAVNPRRFLFDGHAFGEIARLINVTSQLDGDVIRKNLKDDRS